MLSRVSTGELVAEVGTSLWTLAHTGGIDVRTQASVFEEIFLVFLVLGTIVGVVVIGYMLYNGWRYRASVADEPADPPRVGELPVGEGGGKKLALSFTLSAIIVLGLIIWSYSAVLYVDQGPEIEENMEVEVIATQFAWEFVYENGESTTNELVIPQDQFVRFSVTAPDNDVWHTFGVTELRIKADAIPGHVSSEWVIADTPGVYLAECFELCGAGHSFMEADVIVLPPDQFDEWYEEFTEDPDTPIPDPEGA